jgi:hypothetical protein
VDEAEGGVKIQPIPKPDRYAKRGRIDYTKSAIPKQPPVRLPGFRAFARTKGCKVAGVEGHVCGPRVSGGAPIEFAHIGTYGKGMKSPDSHGFGLCHDAHKEQHAIGWLAFARKYHIKPTEIAADLFAEYERRRGGR